MSGLAELLGETGPLKDCVRGFSPRIEQQQMAEATAETIAARNFIRMVAGGAAAHSDHGRGVAEV